MIERLLSNTVKENLVARAGEWEGLHCAEALIDGRPLPGVWYTLSEEYEAVRRASRRGTSVAHVVLESAQ